jgi:hypothetical protein
MIAASFYLFVGIILLLFAAILYYFTISQGFRFLSIGFFMFFIYCLGKGAVMFYISSQRYSFYKNIETLDPKQIAEETQYTKYRIAKKNTNRRRYIYTIVISCMVAFAGIFSQQKAILMGTSIPIALIAGIEFSIGLLTEFRLREFYRLLLKN